MENKKQTKYQALTASSKELAIQISKLRKLLFLAPRVTLSSCDRTEQN